MPDPAQHEPRGASLAGRAGIVTGAARGIGQAVAAGIVAEGGSVVVVDVDAEAARETADDLGPAAIAAAADVRAFTEIEAAVSLCREAFGHIDFMVANAGIGDYSSMADGDVERWRRVIDTNLLGVAHTVRAVLPHLKEIGRGDVVLMSSIAGRNAWAGEPIYIATKWGIVGLGHSLRAECTAWGVRVTLIEPSIVDTPLVRSTAEGRAELERYASLQPADVGRAVVTALAQPPHMLITEIELRPLGPDL